MSKTYLYFCSVRTLNPLGTAYTDDPPREFRVFSKEADSSILGTVDVSLDANLRYDSVLPVLPVLAVGGERDIDCRLFLRLTDSGKTFYVSFDNFESKDDPLVFRCAGVVSDDALASLAAQYPDVFKLSAGD